MEKRYVKILLFLLLLSPVITKAQQAPNAGEGQIFYLQKFKSKFVTERDIAVWVPKNYSKKKRYAVLYMHDGQMLFDSTITWNHQEWGVDETMQNLIDNKKIFDCIVVGIYNGGTERHSEYSPQKPFESLPELYKDSLINLGKRQNGNKIFSANVKADDYLKFIAEELKPYIDIHFSTQKEKSHTLIAGSSMGGLISLYAICEYPEVFGGAICMSTHWPLSFTSENNLFPKAMFDYMKQKLPGSSDHKIYFDYGDQTLDAIYGEFQKQADAVMRERGYGSKNWKTNFFEGDDHSERSWKKRLFIPIEFMMRKDN
jgi:predicted alpha/beta superfamily hydrolase